MEGENHEIERKEDKNHEVRVSEPTADKLVEETSGKVGVEGSDIIQIRKDKIINFFKKRYNWISYVLLFFLVLIAYRIRTRNLPGLKDITTNDWTLGPDLDPFLFLRYAKEIVETGEIVALDTMRYVPIGFDTTNELLFLPYLMAWFHNILGGIFNTTSVIHSSVLFPAFMFAITVIAFFFFSRKIFINRLGEINANIIALLSSFFLIVLPPLLPRTIAGIPEKESAAFFFLFLAFYFFLNAWESKSKHGKYIYAILSGLSTAGMANIWGGYGYIFLTLSIAVFSAFILGQINKDKFKICLIWVISAFALMYPFSSRYSIPDLVKNLNTGLFIAVLFIIVIHLLIFNTNLGNSSLIQRFRKIPKPIVSVIISVFIGVIIISVLFGPGFILEKIGQISSNLIKPAQDRLIQTVAENRQPYFGEWAGNFGPQFKGIPIFFWLFFAGSTYLFFKMGKIFMMKEKIILTIGYVIFLTSIIFSRYDGGHTLNGENSISLSLYFGGTILFLLIVGYYYHKYYKEGIQDRFRQIEFGLIVLFSFFILGIISARGAVRLIMMLVPSTSIIVSYFVVSSINDTLKIRKENIWKWLSWIVVFVIIVATIFAGYQYYKISDGTASGYIPSPYTQQWQKAMSWVRENTPEDAVFGHWWDYGYWLQSIGERATVLDGGNAVSYWNHLMGRHGLTGSDERAALEFLYAHNTTHFLIDSSDIGKYTAFSSIGSDENYDRRSWVNTFFRDNSQTFEAKNRTVMLYTGGVSLDADIFYEKEDGTKVFLPGLNDGSGGNLAGLGAVRVEIDESGNILQPIGIYIYQNVQYELPLRYVYYEDKLVDFGSGVEATTYFMMGINQQGNNLQFDENAIMMYLSPRVAQSQLAKLYLYEKENKFFKLVHVEDDFIVSNLKSQGANIDSIIYFNGMRGPIKIWEINYPDDIEIKEEYLETTYPEILRVVK